ncbi:MAG TPA: tRNA pseudouridine(13) synthase TruD, partial [bacterium]|nr:tRNA pseudouridine(13) synthase TruD [bacterium]
PVKLKATPADFVVQEEASLALVPGPTEFAMYQLTKTSWDTFDLVDLLSRRLRVSRDAIRVGGMKDRHGTTSQVISVRGLPRPPQEIAEANYTLRFRGWGEAPVSARDIAGNTFSITLRDLTPQEAERAALNAGEVARDGIPNYFDEQRFGSARHGQGFMGKEIFLGRRERALRLWFTPSQHDDQKTRRMKRAVLESWGQWQKTAGLGFGDYGRVLAYLAVHRQAYHRALELLDRRFIVFVLNAYQSWLFNELLSRWLARRAAAEGWPVQPLRYSRGTMQFFGPLPPAAAAALQAASLPVPGHDTVSADPLVQELLQEVLGQEGITLETLRVRQMHRIRVGGVTRRAVTLPQDLAVTGPADDDLYPGRQKLALRFFLPRGSYATVLVKRLLLPRQPTARP